MIKSLSRFCLIIKTTATQLLSTMVKFTANNPCGNPSVKVTRLSRTRSCIAKPLPLLIRINPAVNIATTTVRTSLLISSVPNANSGAPLTLLINSAMQTNPTNSIKPDLLTVNFQMSSKLKYNHTKLIGTSRRVLTPVADISHNQPIKTPIKKAKTSVAR